MLFNLINLPNLMGAHRSCGQLGITKPDVIEKSKLYHFIQFFFQLKDRGV
jgi:hypothetical protein